MHASPRPIMNVSVCFTTSMPLILTFEIIPMSDDRYRLEESNTFSPVPLADFGHSYGELYVFLQNPSLWPLIRADDKYQCILDLSIIQCTKYRWKCLNNNWDIVHSIFGPDTHTDTDTHSQDHINTSKPLQGVGGATWFQVNRLLPGSQANMAKRFVACAYNLPVVKNSQLGGLLFSGIIIIVIIGRV